MPTALQQSVWDALKKIPKGRVTSYSALAQFLGKPRAVRAVASAVGKNPNPPITPCHRVVQRDGRVGAYSGKGGVPTKIALLGSEGVFVRNGKICNFEQVYFDFSLKKSWFVYLLKCADNSLYTGICTDLDRRISEHNTSSLGAKYTRARRPVQLVFSEKCADRSAATVRECEIKKMSRAAKEKLIS